MSREVNLSPEAWFTIADTFGEERGPLGEPSRSDFINTEIDDIRFIFGQV